MKKALYFITIFSASILFSCSSEDSGDPSNNSNNNILVKKIITPSGIEEFTYNGNELLRITSREGSNTYITEYSYSGDVITSATELSVDEEPVGYLEFYEYNAEKIIGKKLYYDGQLVEDYLYTYPNNDQIRVQDVLDNYYSILYLNSSGNVIKAESYYEDQLNSTTISTYDNKNSPFKNIKGLNRFILISDYYLADLKNNLLSAQYSNGSNVTVNYIYNEQNFPISVESFDSDDNDSTSTNYYY